jgi:hypothetical protein
MGQLSACAILFTGHVSRGSLHACLTVRYQCLLREPMATGPAGCRPPTQGVCEFSALPVSLVGLQTGRPIWQAGKKLGTLQKATASMHVQFGKHASVPGMHICLEGSLWTLGPNRPGCAAQPLGTQPPGMSDKVCSLPLANRICSLPLAPGWAKLQLMWPYRQEEGSAALQLPSRDGLLAGGAWELGCVRGRQGAAGALQESSHNGGQALLLGHSPALAADHCVPVKALAARHAPQHAPSQRIALGRGAAAAPTRRG